MNLEYLEVEVTYLNKLIFQTSYFKKKKIIIYYLLQILPYIGTIY